MNIGVDLDNTLFANIITEVISKKHGLELPTDYAMMCYPKEVRDECFEAFKDPSLMHGLTPYMDVAQILQYWVDCGHTIYCITARSVCFTDRTKAMVKEHYPMITETFLCESFDKREVFKKLDLDMYIDDHYDCILQAVEVGVPSVVLISNKKTPYNYHGIPVMNRLVRAEAVDSVANIYLPSDGYYYV